MLELFTQFGIDWKLLLAQVVNFFILLIVLKKFAYGPVMKMLAKRQAKIKAGLEASERSLRKLAEADREKADIINQAHTEALEVVEKAEEAAHIQSKNIIEAAHAKGEQVILQSQKKLEEDRLKLSEEFQAHAEELLKMSLGKIISDFESNERDALLIDEALKTLRASSKLL